MAQGRQSQAEAQATRHIAATHGLLGVKHDVWLVRIHPGLIRVLRRVVSEIMEVLRGRSRDVFPN